MDITDLLLIDNSYDTAEKAKEEIERLREELKQSHSFGASVEKAWEETRSVDALNEKLAAKDAEIGRITREKELAWRLARDIIAANDAEIAKLTEALLNLIDAAEKIKHWHCAMKDNSGMVVSKDAVFALWEQLDVARSALQQKESE